MKKNTKKLIIFTILVALSLQLSGCTIGDLFGKAFYKQKPTATPTSKPTATPTKTPTAKPTATPTPMPSSGQREGSYIYFGSYPQSEVTDSSLKSSLTSAAGSTSYWTSYDYYIEVKVSDFMKYKDVTYNGNKYRGVYFTQYRPYWTSDSSSSSNSNQDNNDYYINTIYWFKYEPIKWKILEESNGDAFLVADMLLDSQDYNHTEDNNYANSSIRSWLNSTFYNTAFNSTEQGKIKTTKVDNSAASAGYSSNPYACSNTNDKIFLLSYEEVTNSSYGFSSSFESSSTRVKKLTSYAKAQGAYSYCDAGIWLLRSPNWDYSIYARGVSCNGGVDYGNVDCTDSGVAPALHLTLSPKVTAKPTATPTPKPTATPTPKPTVVPTAIPDGNYGYYTKSGSYITFGSYPQSEVTDSGLKSSLTSAAGSTSNWTSYNYYINSNTSDFMKYKDVTYNGAKYRGVYFTQYRPYYTDYRSSSDNSHQDDNGYYTNTIYWFKYEPIKWKILTESNGDAFLVADMLLDSQHYHTSSNNYANSHIRSWLNSTFYNTAFNSTEQEKIKTTNVDNSVLSIGDLSNPYACSNTNDKIFLLSYKEVTNSSYGFGSDSSRVKKLTSYAKAQGAYSDSGAGWWWLRSPGYYNYGYDARNVYFDGNLNYHNVDRTAFGVAPALHLTLSPKVTAKPTATPTPKPTATPTKTPTAKPTATPTPMPSSGQREGSYIYFGSYPQSEVTDSSLKSSLTSAAGSTSNWTSYDYYIEVKVSDFMKYKDVTYNGNKYRGVYFTQYRPYWTGESSSSDTSSQDDNGYYTNTIYWFKYEPIKWKILTESNGDAFLVADMLLDSQDYDGDNYSSNYANSQIRNWLNSTFLSTAFNSTEQGKIKTTNVDNSVASTGCWSNPYVCSDTNDKIFLLSYKEATNSSYGFGSDSSRVKKLTSYAKAQGAYSDSGAGWWWLRSPGGVDSSDARFVFDGGVAESSINVDYTDNGVVPALHLTL